MLVALARRMRETGPTSRAYIGREVKDCAKWLCDYAVWAPVSTFVGTVHYFHTWSGISSRSVEIPARAGRTPRARETMRNT